MVNCNCNVVMQNSGEHRSDHFIDVAESCITWYSIMSSKRHTSCINSKHIQINEIKNASIECGSEGAVQPWYIVIMQVNSSYFISSYSCFSINIAFLLILTSYSA